MHAATDHGHCNESHALSYFQIVLEQAWAGQARYNTDTVLHDTVIIN